MSVTGTQVVRKFKGRIVGVTIWNGELVVATERGVYAGRAPNKLRRVRLEIIEPQEPE